MMNKILMEEIGEMFEVYMDDMAIKSNNEELHNVHLVSVLKRIQQYYMRLNALKYSFTVRVVKFLDSN